MARVQYLTQKGCCRDEWSMQNILALPFQTLKNTCRDMRYVNLIFFWPEYSMKIMFFFNSYMTALCKTQHLQRTLHVTATCNGMQDKRNKYVKNEK